MASMELSSRFCAEIGVPLDLKRVSQGFSGVPYSKTSHLSCILGNRGITVDPIEGTWASTRVDLGYNEQFHVPLVKSLSF